MIPNPKLKLMDQVREVLRVKHYAIRTEQAYCESKCVEVGTSVTRRPYLDTLAPNLEP